MSNIMPPGVSSMASSAASLDGSPSIVSAPALVASGTVVLPSTRASSVARVVVIDAAAVSDHSPRR